MGEPEIWDALEALAIPKKSGFIGVGANATKREITNQRDHLMRFLDQLDGDLSVAELREALDNYEGGA
jgi:hypothetical protein